MLFLSLRARSWENSKLIESANKQIDYFFAAKQSVEVEIPVELIKIQSFRDTRVLVSEFPADYELSKLMEVITKRKHRIKIIDLSNVRSSHIGKVIQMLTNVKVIFF